MTGHEYELGIIGLGVMGRNILLNAADHGYAVAGYDKNTSKVEALKSESSGRAVYGAENLEAFIQVLRTPRAVMMLVPAGNPVDSVIRDLLLHLEPGDLIIDGGNSYYQDTDLRRTTLADRGFPYLGVGISGGEYGARHGPSMMPGGAHDAYKRVQPIFEAIAAEVDGEPCVTYLGPGSAGHYVKMVHNGIEYGLMQLIAETYDLMKRGLGLSDDELHEVYTQWNGTQTNSYLLKITADIFAKVDEKTGQRLIDVILDAAKQKGTGKWTSQDAMDLQVPAPTIDVAVAMRNLSVLTDERAQAARILGDRTPAGLGDTATILEHLHDAFYAAMIITYAQGMSQLRAASQTHGYTLDLEAVARIWRGGCIIRAGLLDDIRAAYAEQPDLPNLMLDPYFSEEIRVHQESLRTIVSIAGRSGIPAPALMASLAYFDGYRSEWLPANLIQAQRDYFGAHSYERVDEKGAFHTQWNHTAQ